MNVLMYVHWAGVGGAEDMVIDEIRYADRSKIDYLFVTETQESLTHRELSEMGVPIEIVRNEHPEDIEAVARNYRVDLIHTLSCGVLPDSAVKAGLSAGVPVVEVLACVAPPGAIGNPNVYPIYLCYKHRYHGYSNNESARVIMGGVDLERMSRHNGVKQDREEFGLDPIRPVVGWFGRFDQFKCPLSFVDIAYYISLEVPECQFVMFGDGVDRGKAEYLARTRPVNIKFPGMVRNKGKALHLMDVLVFPTWQEAFGRVMPEAMAVGTPIVTNDYPVCMELCDEAAVYVETSRSDPMPRYNALQYSRATISLLGDDVGRERMGSIGAKRAQTLFDARRMSKEYEQLYETILRREKA